MQRPSECLEGEGKEKKKKGEQEKAANPTIRPSTSRYQTGIEREGKRGKKGVLSTSAGVSAWFSSPAAAGGGAEGGEREVRRE